MTELSNNQDLEKLGRSENFLANPDLISIEVNRHSTRTASFFLAPAVFLRDSTGKIARDEEYQPMIKQQSGPVKAREKAAEEAARLKSLGVEVEVFVKSSPSTAPSQGGPKTKVNEAGETVDVKRIDIFPRRAVATGREYVREFSSQGLMIGDGHKNPQTGEISGLKIDRRLGDLLEAYNEARLDNFFSTLKSCERYQGRFNKEFWQDYVNGELEPEVAEAFYDANGWDTYRLTANFLEVVADDTRELFAKKGDRLVKEVDILISHGEVMECVLTNLVKFLKNQPDNHDGQVFIDKLMNGPIYHPSMDRFEMGYNEGFMVHVDPKTNQMIVEIGPSERIGVDLTQFHDFVAAQSKSKTL